jgi:hypothetical protein
LSGILEVAVFLSQIFKCLAASFSSFFFYFSASLAMNTCSSFGGLNGEKFSSFKPCPCRPFPPFAPPFPSLFYES